MIVVPLILIALIGVALQDTSIKNIEANVYSATNFNDSFSASMLDRIEENGINSLKISDLGRCKLDVENGASQLCIEIQEPADSEFELERHNVVLHVDFSRQRTVWSIISRVEGIVEEESEKAQAEMIEEVKGFSNEALKEVERIEAEMLLIRPSVKEGHKIIWEFEEYSLEMAESIDELKEGYVEILTSLTYVRNMLYSLGQDVSDADAAIDGLIDLQNHIDVLSSSNTEIGREIGSLDSKLDSIEYGLEKSLRDLREVKNKLKEAKDVDYDKVLNPIEVSYMSVLADEDGEVEGGLKFLDYLFPSFLIFFILFDAIVFSASLRLRARKDPSHLRNMISGVSGFTFVLGDFLTSLVFISIQSFAIVWIASFFLNLNVFSNLSILSSIIFIAVSIFSLIGLTIGSMLDSQESVIVSSVSLSLLFFVFSSIVTPIETLPKAFAAAVGLMPLTLLETKLRIGLIFGSSVNFAFMEYLTLTAIVAGCCFLIGIFYRGKREQEI